MSKVSAMPDEQINYEAVNSNAINGGAVEHDESHESSTQLIPNSNKPPEETGKLIHSDGVDEIQKKDVSDEQTFEFKHNQKEDGEWE